MTRFIESLRLASSLAVSSILLTSCGNAAIENTAKDSNGEMALVADFCLSERGLDSVDFSQTSLVRQWEGQIGGANLDVLASTGIDLISSGSKNYMSVVNTFLIENGRSGLTYPENRSQFFARRDAIISCVSEKSMTILGELTGREILEDCADQQCLN